MSSLESWDLPPSVTPAASNWPSPSPHLAPPGSGVLDKSFLWISACPLTIMGTAAAAPRIR